ncbi:MAG: histidine kinase [Anaerolineae bacterium]|jgi:signal transduction histidine kinase
MDQTCGICSFFLAHLTEVTFVHGLTFFLTGIVAWLEATRDPGVGLTPTLPFLAVFGLLNGSHQWLEMFASRLTVSAALLPRLTRLAVLALSFIALNEFGVRLNSLSDKRGWPRARWLGLAVFLVGTVLISLRWAPQEEQGWASALEAWCRRSLAVPGSVLAAVGLHRYVGRLELDEEERRLSCNLRVVALAFLFYGIPGQIFVTVSPLPPSALISGELFMALFHVPVQLFRALTAILVAVFTARGVRCFEQKRKRRMEELNRDRLEAQQRLAEEMKACREMERQRLHQTVRAREDERRHIARELHDETAQALTALSLGLGAVEGALGQDPEEARVRLRELRRLVSDVMKKIDRLTTRLRPRMLDDLGLIPALITYADESAAHLPFSLDVYGFPPLTGRLGKDIYREADQDPSRRRARDRARWPPFVAGAAGSSCHSRRSKQRDGSREAGAPATTRCGPHGRHYA